MGGLSNKSYTCLYNFEATLLNNQGREQKKMNEIEMQRYPGVRVLIP